MKVYLKEMSVRITHQRQGHVQDKREKWTYSTCLDHSGGSLNVMNIQLVKIVHMMIMLNNVRRPKLRKNGAILLK